MLKNVIQPLITDTITNTITQASAALGDGFMMNNVGAIVSTVTFGTLSNVPFGSGYGYVLSAIGGFTTTAGSNPSPSTLTILDNVFAHPNIAHYAQYGNNTLRIEIDRTSNFSNHPTSDWLSTLRVQSSVEDTAIDTSDIGWIRYNSNQNPYYHAGALYLRSLGTGNISPFFNSADNNKTLTWGLV